jgi:hypothetical protein
MVSGMFMYEDSRISDPSSTVLGKRPSEVAFGGTDAAPNDIWSQFQHIMMQENNMLAREPQIPA